MAAVPGARFRIGRSAALAAAALSFCLTGLAASQEIAFFRIGTGSTGGTYFPVGGLIASLISNPPGSRPCDRGGSCGVDGLIAVAQSTQGSVENIDAISEGRLESGLVQADIAYWAFHGSGPYAEKGPVSDLRVIANLYPEALQIVVRRDSGIAGVRDLAGKRVSLGEEASGTLVDALIVLGAYGLDEDDLVPFYLNPGPSNDMMVAGELDAYFLVAGTPTNVIMDLGQQIDIDLLPIDGEEAAALIAEYPFFAMHLVPALTYPGTLEIRTLSVGAQWAVSAAVPDDLVYGITRALWHENSRRLLDAGHPKGRLIRPQSALHGLGIPLHPGAARYYEEIGALEVAPQAGDGEATAAPAD